MTSTTRTIIICCAWCTDGVFEGGSREHAMQQARKHVLTCPDHPARKAEERLNGTRIALADLVRAARTGVALREAAEAGRIALEAC